MIGSSNMLGRIAVMLVLGCCSLSVQAKYGGGSGEPNNPYLIYDANQMYAIGIDANDWDKCFKLMADIDLGQFDGKDGRPKFRTIGYASISTVDTYYVPFTGSFDGNNHTISNFTYTSTDSNDFNSVGLFGDIYDPNSEIKNLGLIGPNVTGNDYMVGSLVGRLGEGTISNCYAEGCSVTGRFVVGGLVGGNGGTINNCYTIGSVSGYKHVGGLVGNNGGTITNCYTIGSVSGYQYVGGLVGLDVGTINNCNSNTSVSGSIYVGGLIGIVGTEILGFSPGYIVSNCYSTGSVSGTNVVGGLVGYNILGTITNCFSVGSVTGSGKVGGLVGNNRCSPYFQEWCGVIVDSYWNIETSGEPNMCGSEEGNASGCDNSYGKTTAELYQQSTFQDWDFINVWNIGENQTYPYLRTFLAGDINKDRITNFFDLNILCNQWMEGVEE
jgi:hypothetical protein